MYTAWAVIAAALISGCARPKGELFPPVSPRIVWPTAPEQPRIAWIGEVRDSRDLKPARSAGEAFVDALRGPLPPIRLLGPHGIAVRDSRFVAVADTASASVHLLDLAARTHILAGGVSEQERFVAPVGVAWLSGRLFVTDAGLKRVFELDAAGRVVRQFGDDVLARPVGIAYVPDRGQLYVVDGGAHCLQVFSPEGILVRTIGTRGEAPGAFNYPSHLAVQGDVLAVSDSGNFRVQLLDLDGNCRRIIGSKGDGAGDFALPKGVAIGRTGYVYVVDTQFENFQIFSPSGELMLAVGQEGAESGAFSLPSGIAIDSQDRIWVSDSGNHRLQVFQFLAERS